MDVICNCAFGIDIDCQANPQHDFFVKSMGVFEDKGMYRWESKFGGNQTNKVTICTECTVGYGPYYTYTRYSARYVICYGTVAERKGAL